jgi:toxin-antitoxin system PIN domain toxin
MTSLLFPDVNVWVALHHQAHKHHSATLAWFGSLASETTLVFCRHTQMGMFRLLTTEAVMGGEALTQRECWSIYAKWMVGGRATHWLEPVGVSEAFQKKTTADEPSPKSWADAYLAAFAEVGGMRLVTLDRALAGRSKGAVLLC